MKRASTGQPAGCESCKHEFKIGDSIMNHLTENHLNELLIYLMHTALDTKQVDRIYSNILGMED